jgi:hypothetical protein
MTKSSFVVIAIFVVCAAIVLSPDLVNAHCDTLSGPVVLTAKAALEKGDVTPVLKWVKKEDEKEIREAFARTLAVRKQSTDARELADTYFFETLVRIHRAGEGAPYTGLKAAEAGRKYVHAYVEFTHYVERLHMDAVTAVEHHREMKETDTGKGRQH